MCFRFRNKKQNLNAKLMQKFNQLMWLSPMVDYLGHRGKKNKT